MLNPDLPLVLRVILVALPLLASAYGFATGSILLGVIGIAVGGWLFNRLFLLGAPADDRPIDRDHDL
ncbi:hypothetical protein ACEYYB_03150 [Paracoccus sp. p4-l81]|uniref:hypothetical protein n=1 Tax=unclassified Paracoccus (in: a-proteobacteria) TaxID=2688777 RepID=UPI0035B7FE31